MQNYGDLTVLCSWLLVPLKKFLGLSENVDRIVDWEVVEGQRHVGFVQEVRETG